MAPRRKNLNLILTLTKRKTMLMSWVQKMNMKTRRELEYLATMLMMKMLMNNHTTMKIMVMMATDGAFCQRLIEALRQLDSSVSIYQNGLLGHTPTTFLQPSPKICFLTQGWILDPLSLFFCNVKTENTFSFYKNQCCIRSVGCFSFCFIFLLFYFFCHN